MKRGSIFETDGIPRIQEALPLALQHVVAMIVGCVTPAIIVAGAAGLEKGDPGHSYSGSSGSCCVVYLAPAFSHWEEVQDWFRTSHHYGCQLRICTKYAGHCGRVRNRHHFGSPDCRRCCCRYHGNYGKKDQGIFSTSDHRNSGIYHRTFPVSHCDQLHGWWNL